jgi:hypothetical protein
MSKQYNVLTFPGAFFLKTAIEFWLAIWYTGFFALIDTLLGVDTMKVDRWTACTLRLAQLKEKTGKDYQFRRHPHGEQKLALSLGLSPHGHPGLLSPYMTPSQLATFLQGFSSAIPSKKGK